MVCGGGGDGGRGGGQRWELREKSLLNAGVGAGAGAASCNNRSVRGVGYRIGIAHGPNLRLSLD